MCIISISKKAVLGINPGWLHFLIISFNETDILNFFKHIDRERSLTRRQEFSITLLILSLTLIVDISYCSVTNTGIIPTPLIESNALPITAPNAFA